MIERAEHAATVRRREQGEARIRRERADVSAGEHRIVHRLPRFPLVQRAKHAAVGASEHHTVATDGERFDQEMARVVAGGLPGVAGVEGALDAGIRPGEDDVVVIDGEGRHKGIIEADIVNRFPRIALVL